MAQFAEGLEQELFELLRNDTTVANSPWSIASVTTLDGPNNRECLRLEMRCGSAILVILASARDFIDTAPFPAEMIGTDVANAIWLTLIERMWQFDPDKYDGSVIHL